MRERLRFVLVGGFLGAGKTTALARLARLYASQGLRVGIITNDLACGLVDTLGLRAAGLKVDELTGAGLADKFDELAKLLVQKADKDALDLVLVESMGTAVDLATTVVQPLEKFHSGRIDVGPLVVLLKPEHAREILSGKDRGAATKAAYIFLKQLEEADLIVFNKIDRLLPAERDAILRLVHTRYPDKQVLTVSARQGDGFAELQAALDCGRVGQRSAAEVDYDRYAAADAEFGWLDARIHARNRLGDELPLDYLALELVTRMEKILRHTGGEPAHIKVLGRSGEDIAICNLVSGCEDVDLSIASHARGPEIQLNVNIRAAADPERLVEALDLAMSQMARARNMDYEIVERQSFRPPAPAPQHRLPIITARPA